MVEFDIVFTEEFLVEARRRGRMALLLRSWKGICWSMLKLFLGAVLLAVAVFFVVGHIWSVALIMIFFAVLLLVSPRLDDWFARRKFKKSVYWNDHVHLCLSEEGFSGTGEKSKVSFDWSIFSSAWRFKDGILLFHEGGETNWLPFDRIVSGSREELVQLVRRKVKLGRPVMNLTKRTH